MASTETEINKVLFAKINDYMEACDAIGYFARKIPEALARYVRASPEKILGCLAYIYDHHQPGLDYIINGYGLIVQTGIKNNDEPKPWIVEARKKWDAILSPKPLFDPMSGCYKIWENEEVVWVTEAKDWTLKAFKV